MNFDALFQCITAISIACICAYVALEYLGAWRRRNDLVDRFQEYEREAGNHMLNMRLRLEKLEKIVR